VFTVEAFPASELGNASFLIADADRGVGLVVDPYRDVDDYLTRADELRIKLTHALDTHVHNDFVSGRRELAAEAGTAIDELDAGPDLPVGDFTVPALRTPGHTPAPTSYLLLDKQHPRALLSRGAWVGGSTAPPPLPPPHPAL